MKTEHILIIRFSAMGDVAMTVPVVYSLARQYPHLRISVLSKPFAHAFYDELAPNVEFMAADLKNDYQHIRGLNKLFRRLIAKQFTAIADFHDVLRTKYLRLRFCLDGGFKVAHINKHHTEKRLLTKKESKRLTPIQSSFQNYADVLAQLGYPIHIQFTSIFEDKDISLKVLTENIGERKCHEYWIGIAPFAAHKGKIYPLPLMENTIHNIQERYKNIRIFLFGGSDAEKNILTQWTQKYNCCTSVPCVLKGLQQELILMSQLNAMISMDSANMHLASLVNIPVISIWGATHPYAGFMGWNQSINNAVQIDMSCRPCSIYGNKPCFREDYACLNNIKSKQIIKKLDKILNTKN